MGLSPLLTINNFKILTLFFMTIIHKTKRKTTRSRHGSKYLASFNVQHINEAAISAIPAPSVFYTAYTARGHGPRAHYNKHMLFPILKHLSR